MKITLLSLLRTVESEEELDRVGFVRSPLRIINFPKNKRKVMKEYIESGDKEKEKIWFEEGGKYTLEVFHPKDSLFCLMSSDGGNIIYPSIRYRRLKDNSLKFKEVGAFIKQFNSSPMINRDSGKQIDQVFFCDEINSESKEGKAAVSLLV